jgi:RecA-family ATPase
VDAHLHSSQGTKAAAADPMLQEALDYAKCGLAVFPAQGKIPFKHSHGVKDASIDPGWIRGRWAEHPGANIAIACGSASQIIVVDDDSDEARAELATLEVKHGPLPPTAMSKTKRGHHRYFAIPKGRRIPHKGKRNGSPLEIISDRHYVLAPPSIHPSGIGYEWANDITEFAEAPNWLIQYATEKTGRTVGNRDNNRSPARIRRGITQDTLNNYSPEAYSEKAEARIRDALRFLKSDDEEDWFHRAAEIHSLNWEEKGYAILDDWSGTTQSENYNSEKNRKRWDELNPDREEKRTIGSLFHDAKEKGWDRQAFEQEWETRDSSQQANAPTLNLKIFRGNELLSTAAPPRRWLIESWIPAAETTMLGGDGGMGKTTLGLQLSVAAVSGQDWLGCKVKRCNVLYVSAEDPKDEIHFRLEQIARHLTITQIELAGFKLIDLAGEDSAIALFEKDGRLKRTAVFGEIENAAREHSAGCIIFDAVADFFGGNENERREVRAFVGLLRGLAMRLDAAVVVIAHPSVDAIKTGRGYSGSTHWNNAVRSRLYFTEAEVDETGVPPHPDLRVIKLAKTNRARPGEKIHMFWFDGRFVLTSREASRNLKNEAEAEELFLQLLQTTTKQGANVSLNLGKTYAPAFFAKMPGSKGIGKASLEAAMHRLIEKKKIRNEGIGSPSRIRHRLVIEPNTSGPGGQ